MRGRPIAPIADVVESSGPGTTPEARTISPYRDFSYRCSSRDGTVLSPERNSFTASRLNSIEYGGIFGIRDILSRLSTLNHQVSTKPGELHQRSCVSSGTRSNRSTSGLRTGGRRSTGATGGSGGSKAPTACPFASAKP